MALVSGSGITISRTPYEEPYHLNLKISASNGRQSGELEYYCVADDLPRIGREMQAYTGKNDPDIVYELGSEKPEDRFAFFLRLRVHAINYRGHCCVIVRLNNNQSAPEAEMSEFAIPAYVADINRLGALLVEFGQLCHRALRWQVTSGELIE